MHKAVSGGNGNAGARAQVAAAAPGEEVVDFRGYFKVEIFPHNAMVYRAGDAVEKVYLLRSGRVRVMRAGRGQQTSVLQFLKPGDLFGEFLRSPGAALEESAFAAGEAEVWSIEARDFRALIEARPALAVDVIRSLNERIRQLKSRVAGLTSKEVPARLAETLAGLAESLGERCTHGGEYDLRGVTQQDLADLVGASRSFVSTIVNEMKRAGLLANVGRTLCIRDSERLKEEAARQK